jgi:AAA15 family ATPase/GTPase
MLTSFTVKKYRLFDTLTIESLSRLNLIAGKNNVGKTTLLEALWLYSGSTNPNLSIGVNTFRGIDTFRLTPAGPWENLFRNFDTQFEIVMSATGEHELRITLEDMPEVRIPVDNGQSIDTLGQQERSLPRIKYQTLLPDGEVITQHVRFENGNLVFESRNILLNAIFLSARVRFNPREMALRFTEIEQRLEEGYVLEGLQVIEPRIQDIRMSYTGETPIFQCRVDIPGLEKRRVLLNYMGSGIFRYFEMLLAIVVNRDGLLLIDEIENGVHHSVMTKVWKAIHKLAVEFNVQVFATTHSIECIKAAYEALKETPAGSYGLHRLEEKAGNIEVVSYSEDALAGAIEYEIEVR